MTKSKSELPEEIKKKLTMTMTYLYAGPIKSSPKGKPQIVPGSLEPIKHQWIAGPLDLLDEVSSLWRGINLVSQATQLSNQQAST